MMLEVMRAAKNYFVEGALKEYGMYSITDGVITFKNSYPDGSFVLISGSRLNSGVHRVSALGAGEYFIEGAVNETFDGVVFGVLAPPDFIALVREIEGYVRNNPESNVVSESFGAYSYSVAKDGGGNPVSWQDVFAKRLNKYRKMFDGMAENGVRV